MASVTDQAFILDIDTIVGYDSSGSERVLNGPMRHFLFHNTSTTRNAFVSWSGNDDHIVIPPGRTIAVNGRSQVERLFVRSAGPAAGAMLLQVSCSSHAPLYSA